MTVVVPTYTRSGPTVVETLDGVPLRVDAARLGGYHAEATIIVEPPRSSHIDDHPLTVGARVYTVGRDPSRTAEEVEADPAISVLISLDGGRKGVALIAWWQPDHHSGPSMRAQAFRADVLTHDPRLAVASSRVLRENGWPR